MPTASLFPPRLYQFYIGGTAGRANIELHDVQFAAVARVQDAYPALREAWFGDPSSLHLDGYVDITWADGFDVRMADGLDPSGLTLFFVNMGGYRKDTLAELHEFGLCVTQRLPGVDQPLHQLRRRQHRGHAGCLLRGLVCGIHVPSLAKTTDTGCYFYEYVNKFVEKLL